MEIYCLSGQETRSPKSGCQQGSAPSGGSKRDCFLTLPVSGGGGGIPWLVAASVSALSSHLSLYNLPCVSVSKLYLIEGNILYLYLVTKYIIQDKLFLLRSLI